MPLGKSEDEPSPVSIPVKIALPVRKFVPDTAPYRNAYAVSRRARTGAAKVERISRLRSGRRSFLRMPMPSVQDAARMSGRAHPRSDAFFAARRKDLGRYLLCQSQPGRRCALRLRRVQRRQFPSVRLRRKHSDVMSFATRRRAQIRSANRIPAGMGVPYLAPDGNRMPNNRKQSPPALHRAK